MVCAHPFLLLQLLLRRWAGDLLQTKPRYLGPLFPESHGCVSRRRWHYYFYYYLASGIDGEKAAGAEGSPLMGVPRVPKGKGIRRCAAEQEEINGEQEEEDDEGDLRGRRRGRRGRSSSSTENGTFFAQIVVLLVRASPGGLEDGGWGIPSPRPSFWDSLLVLRETKDWAEQGSSSSFSQHTSPTSKVFLYTEEDAKYYQMPSCSYVVTHIRAPNIPF